MTQKPKHEICLNCQFWSETHRRSYDAGAMSICIQHSYNSHIHESEESVMIYAEEHNPDLVTCMPILTRKTFGCNQFKLK